jgi:tetratricopeptide (TPR) repeat protein
MLECGDFHGKGEHLSDTTASEHSPETKLRVWRAFARAVADLHRRNILRPDVDDVNRVAYDAEADAAAFPPSPYGEMPLSHPATPRDLAQNLLPLLQFVQASKGDQPSLGVWDLFVGVYLQSMDQRGAEVLRVLAGLQDDLRQASELNMKALSLAYVGKTADAIAAFQECLKLRVASGDHEGYCRTLCNLALVYAEAKDFPKALQTVDAAVSWGRLHRRIKGTCLALFQKGLLLNQQGNRDEALRCVDQAVHTWERTGQPVPTQFTALAAALRPNVQLDEENGEVGERDG